MSSFPLFSFDLVKLMSILEIFISLPLYFLSNLTHSASLGERGGVLHETQVKRL